MGVSTRAKSCAQRRGVTVAEGSPLERDGAVYQRGRRGEGVRFYRRESGGGWHRSREGCRNDRCDPDAAQPARGNYQELIWTRHAFEKSAVARSCAKEFRALDCWR